MTLGSHCVADEKIKYLLISDLILVLGSYQLVNFQDSPYILPVFCLVLFKKNPTNSTIDPKKRGTWKNFEIFFKGGPFINNEISSRMWNSLRGFFSPWKCRLSPFILVYWNRLVLMCCKTQMHVCLMYGKCVSKVWHRHIE